MSVIYCPTCDWPIAGGRCACTERKRMGDKWKLEISEYDDVMTMAQFISQCSIGAIIDYDGSGNYSDGKYIFTDKHVVPSDIPAGKLDTSYSHVVWFNK
jgi:hypothetical protein